MRAHASQGGKIGDRPYMNNTNSYPLRVLVVDGSADDRKKIVDVLASALDIEVVGEAGDGDEALHLAAAVRPNVVTLELELPKMDGFTFLRILMSRQPTPVIVLSSHLQKENVFTALELGAVDFVVKPDWQVLPDSGALREQLLDKMQVIRRLRIGPGNDEVDRSPLLARPDDVVPVAMEVIALDLQLSQFLCRYLLAGRIAVTVESGAHDEATSVGRVADEVDDGLVGPQRASTPVDRDEPEQAVLDLVPLAGAGGKVADVDRHVELVGDALQLVLPDVRPIAVAAAGVGRDEYLTRLGVALRANLIPPCLDRGHREHWRVVVDADADEAVVGGEVVDAVRDCLADRIGRKVVDVHQVGLALGLPLASAVLEVADQLLLLGVDGDDRDAPLDAVLRLRVDVLELRVAVGMLGTFDGLVWRLQAVAVVAQQLGHRLVTEPDAVLGEQLC